MIKELSFYERTGFHSFDEIYQTHYDKIEKYVQRRVQSNSDVEDIVQKTFLAFFEKKDDFISESKNAVERYLYGTARVRTADYYRNKIRGRKNEKRLEEGQTMSQFSRGEITYVDEKEELVQKIKTILSEEQQKVFLLRVFEGCRYREIGEKLGISEDTARQRQLRARKKLRSEMKEYKFDKS